MFVAVSQFLDLHKFSLNTKYFWIFVLIFFSYAHNMLSRVFLFRNFFLFCSFGFHMLSICHLALRVFCSLIFFWLARLISLCYLKYNQRTTKWKISYQLIWFHTSCTYITRLALLEFVMFYYGFFPFDETRWILRNETLFMFLIIFSKIVLLFAWWDVTMA